MPSNAISCTALFYNARYYDPGIARFVSADSIVPGAGSLTLSPHDAVASGAWAQRSGGPGNPQDLNRYSYGLNNPVRNTDPTGHCPTCIGAVVGGAVGLGLYLWSESQQSDGIGWEDLGDAAIAAGTGAAAGALIATPGMQSLGIGMATSLAGDHIGNIALNENFSAVDHGISAATGLVGGAVSKAVGVSGELLPIATKGVQIGFAGAMGVVDSFVKAGVNGQITNYSGGDVVTSVALNAGTEALSMGIGKGVTGLYGHGVTERVATQAGISLYAQTVVSGWDGAIERGQRQRGAR